MADQAIIAESVTTGTSDPPALIAAGPEAPMPIIAETKTPDLAGTGGAIKSK
jgi:hypothetical protein